MNELATGIVIDNRYTMQKLIGRGSFGEVWLAHDEVDDEDVALKLYITLDPEGIDDFRSEFFTTTGLFHPNLLVPKNFDIWQSRPYLVMKYCSSGPSTNLVGMIDEDRLWRFIHDVASGLAYLHGNCEPIIHQDIKPDNILIGDDGDFLITDFGISKKVQRTMDRKLPTSTFVGAVAYMSPERFGENPELVKASDIWSFGASIYELASGRLPFNGMGGAMQRNGADMPHLPAPTWSKELNDLIARCLAVEPWDRPTAEEIEHYATAILRGEAPVPPWAESKEAYQKPVTPSIEPIEQADDDNELHYMPPLPAGTHVDAGNAAQAHSYAQQGPPYDNEDTHYEPQYEPEYEPRQEPQYDPYEPQQPTYAHSRPHVGFEPVAEPKITPIHTDDDDDDNQSMPYSPHDSNRHKVDYYGSEPRAGRQNRKTSHTLAGVLMGLLLVLAGLLAYIKLGKSADEAEMAQDTATEAEQPQTAYYDDVQEPDYAVDDQDPVYITERQPSVTDTRGNNTANTSTNTSTNNTANTASDDPSHRATTPPPGFSQSGSGPASMPAKPMSGRSTTTTGSRSTTSRSSSTTSGSRSGRSEQARLQDARRTGDYATIRQLADNGNAEACGDMAMHCFKQGDYKSAENYALKAKSAGVPAGQQVISLLQKSGYYD